jgi:DNA-binding transcriptional regulator YhcF (GntR family)
MKYNFTDEVRKVLAMSRDEAIRFRHDYVGTEHILLGVLRASEPTCALARRLGAEPRTIRKRLEQAIRPGKTALAYGELPYTSRAKKTLEFGMAAARDLGDDFVDTKHLFIGLLREEKGIAAQVLNSVGVTLERAQAAIRRPGAGDPVEPYFGIGIDDASDLSIYEQIIARVREAVATGELLPGSRLPPVRRLADQLDIAPGTVARAYSELERLGVVVTEGARGTRVADMPRPSRPGKVDSEMLVGLLRPVAVAAFHMGAVAEDLRVALEEAMTGIFQG